MTALLSVPLQAEAGPACSAPAATRCTRCGVRPFSWLSSVPEEALAQWPLPLEDVRLAPGERLYDPGAPALSFYTVRAGVLMLERRGENGERRVVRLAAQSDVLGLEGLMQPHYLHEARAFTDVALCRLGLPAVRQLLAEQPRLYEELLRRYQRALEAAEAWQTGLCRGLARSRVLRLLQTLAGCFGGERVALPSREDIGAMLDIRVETASRTVSQLRRERLLQPTRQGDWRVDLPGVRAALAGAA